MKQQIEEALSVLVGLALLACKRDASAQIFEFGEWCSKQRDTDAWQVAEYALHVQCAWRVYDTHKQSVLYDWPDFDWIMPGAGLGGAQRMAMPDDEFKRPLIVEEVQVSQLGILRLLSKEGLSLDIIPANTNAKEYWRFFKVGTPESPVIFAV